MSLCGHFKSLCSCFVSLCGHFKSTCGPFVSLLLFCVPLWSFQVSLWSVCVCLWLFYVSWWLFKVPPWLSQVSLCSASFLWLFSSFFVLSLCGNLYFLVIFSQLLQAMICGWPDPDRPLGWCKVAQFRNPSMIAMLIRFFKKKVDEISAAETRHLNKVLVTQSTL